MFRFELKGICRVCLPSTGVFKDALTATVIPSDCWTLKEVVRECIAQMMGTPSKFNLQTEDILKPLGSFIFVDKRLPNIREVHFFSQTREHTTETLIEISFQENFDDLRISIIIDTTKPVAIRIDSNNFGSTFLHWPTVGRSIMRCVKM